tara:strand:+ start:618 stop:878 length:261 start_codon:yes stop_codon:yes gene_type:complete
MEDQEQPKTREEILEISLEARLQEVMGYQINIDNYTIALNEISKRSQADQAELSEFSEQLRNLLTSEKLEQKKAEIMLIVIQQQVS